MSERDNFSDTQRKHLLGLNSEAVSRRWPSEFKGKNDHFMCENCKWVNDNSTLFEIDHILPCVEGGTANRYAQDDYSRILAGDLEQLHKSGINSMVLCRGCNRGKGKKQFIPGGSGYAHKSPYKQMDRYPDHIYYGGPLPY